jgi:macrodomain Ter protein organizer (MatP/YcbG family)
MADTTIKVDSTVRDRLAVLAAQRGATIRDLVTELAANTPTQEELAAGHASATAYLREHLSPELDDDDLAGGERFWLELETRRAPGGA